MRERSRDNYRTNKTRRPDLLNLPDTGEIEVTFLSRPVGSLQYKLNRPGDYEILAESYLPEHEDWGRRVAREKLDDPIAKHPGPDGSELHGTGSDQTVHGGQRTVFHGTRWMKGEEILDRGWDPEMEGRGLGGVWGKGAYFAPGYDAADSWSGRSGNGVVLQAEVPDDVKILQVQSAGLSPAAISGAFIPTEEDRMDLFRASNPPEVIEMFEEVGRLYDEEDVFPTEGVERVVTDAGYQALEVLPGTEEARVEGMEFFATGGHQLVIYDEAVTKNLKFRVAEQYIQGEKNQLNHRFGFVSVEEMEEPDQEPAEWLRALEANSRELDAAVSKRQRTWYTVVRRNNLPKDVLGELIVKHGGDSHDQSSHGNWARGGSASDELLSTMKEVGEQFGSASMMGTVAEHGRSYPPPTAERNAQLMDIHGVEPGRMKQCFENAGRHMIDDNELTYVEGYAFAHKLKGIPVHHAWLVTPDGEVIDPTWGSHNPGFRGERYEPGIAYHGIPIKRDFLMKHLVRTGTWGVFKGVPLEAEVADIVAK